MATAAGVKANVHIESRTNTGDDELLFAERPDWADVTPLEQYVDINPLAPIFYTEEYKDATNYFRGIVQMGEMSPRVLKLTERIISMNPAHYSAWQYRYKTLLAIQAPLDVELRLMDNLAIKYLKTYQVWHHRRLLITHLHPKPSLSSSSIFSPQDVPTYSVATELDFIASALKMDAKNYHTWSYRQWLLAYFTSSSSTSLSSAVDMDLLWASELAFVNGMLSEDLRNNSAWHHRFFVVFQVGGSEGSEGRGGVVKEEVRRRELTFVKQYIALAPNNASAWNYLRGVLDHTHTPYSTLQDFVLPYAAAKSSTGSTSGAEGVADSESLCSSSMSFADPSSVSDDQEYYSADEREDDGVAVDAKAHPTVNVDPSAAPIPEQGQGAPADVKLYADGHTADDLRAHQESEIVDLENPLPSKGAQLPCTAAIEFLADIYEAEGSSSTEKAVELWKSLANQHDTIRKKYWEYRINEASRT